jgi:hypothetical protein
MMAEDMAEKALILTRTIHDRYHARKRNPFNEVECSDHYARAMASYGTFITACGFTYHGPKGEIGFDPKLNKENFNAAFTVAEGWGTYSEVKNGKSQEHTLALKHGKLSLQRIALAKTEKVKAVSVTLDSQPVVAKVEQQGSSVQISLGNQIEIREGQVLRVVI